MFFKIHKSYRDIVAICDENLVGKTFEKDNFQLFLKENFYKGDKIDSIKLLELLKTMAKEDAIFNIVGENSVNLAIKSGIISKDSVKTIQNIPFSMSLL